MSPRDFLSPQQVSELRREHKHIGMRRHADRLKAILMLNKGRSFQEIRDDLLDDLFFAIEKPVPWEIVGNGLLHGLPGKVKGNVGPPEDWDGNFYHQFRVHETSWDNIHIWGGFTWGLTGKQLPSTPGAFHSFHLHWRWGYVVTDPTFRQKIKLGLAGGVASFGSEQFHGLKMAGASGIGGPLLDPLLPSQSIRFAITETGENWGKSWKVTAFPSTKKYEELFESPSDPRPLFEGVNLLFWLSFDAKRESKRTFGGTFFIHGFYFAHNVEPRNGPANDTLGASLFKYGGGIWKFYYPSKVPQILIRDADGKFLE